MKLKVTNEKNPWRGQEGELVRLENGAEAPSGPEDVVIVRMAGNRAVEFKASDLSPVEDDDKDEAK